MKLNSLIFTLMLVMAVAFFSVSCSNNSISSQATSPSIPTAPTMPYTATLTTVPLTATPIPPSRTSLPATATDIPPTFTSEATAVSPEPLGTPVFFFIAPDGHLYSTDVAGSFQQQLTQLPETLDGNSEVWRSFYYYRLPQLSPDRQWLILNDGRGGWTLQAVVSPRIQSQGRGNPLLSPAWSPDSQSFVYIGQNNELCLFELATQTTICPFQAEDKLIGASWSPSGDQVAVAVVGPECCAGDVWLVTLADGSAAQIATHATALESRIDDILAWAAQPPTLLIKAQADGPAALYSPESGTLQTLSGPVRDLSVNGRYLLYNSGEIGESDGSILYTPSNLCEPDQLTLLQEWDWSPSGEQLAYLTTCQTDDDEPTKLSVVDLTTGTLLWQLEVMEPLQLVYWSPDSMYLLLDQADVLPQDSPIWRITADGSGPLETAVAEGFLLGTIP